MSNQNTPELAKAEQELLELLRKRDEIQGKLDGARAVLRRIKRSVKKYGFLPANPDYMLMNEMPDFLRKKIEDERAERALLAKAGKQA